MSFIEEQPAADRAQAYVALLGFFQAEMDPTRLGQCVESWARFVAPASLSKAALVSALSRVRDRTPIVSLLRACATLDVDISDVVMLEIV